MTFHLLLQDLAERATSRQSGQCHPYNSSASKRSGLPGTHSRVLVGSSGVVERILGSHTDEAEFRAPLSWRCWASSSLMSPTLQSSNDISVKRRAHVQNGYSPSNTIFALLNLDVSEREPSAPCMETHTCGTTYSPTTCKTIQVRLVNWQSADPHGHRCQRGLCL